MSYKYIFTIFTPTFNRRHTIHRVFESLKRQTFQNFEWLIVDDGSTDGTRDLVRKWQQEAHFSIRYIYQQNKGKHVAFNRGVRESSGQLFLILDSDDACVPNALERFKYHWDAIPNNEKDRFSTVTALCMDQNGKLLGDGFPFDVFNSENIWQQIKYRSAGDKWGFNRTDVLKEYTYPEILGEKFIAEGIVWNRISQKYKTRFINEKLKTVEYMKDGLSANSTNLRAKNPIGARLYYQELIHLPIPFLLKIKNCLNYIRFSFHAGICLQQMIIDSGYNILTTLLWPVGYIYYMKDCQILKNH